MSSFAPKIPAQSEKLSSLHRRRHLAAQVSALSVLVLAFVGHDCRAGGMAFDAAGNLYLSATQSVIKFAPDGTKTTFATGLMNASGLAFDHKGNLLVSDAGSLSIFRFAPDGTKKAYMTEASSSAMAFDSTDNFYIAQGGSVYKFTPDGVKSTFASGLGTARDIAIDGTGNVFVLESSSDLRASVEKFGPGGEKYPFLFEIRLQNAAGLALDAAGNVYLAGVTPKDTGHAVLKFTPDGQQSTFAEAPDANTQGSIAINKAGNAFVFNGASMSTYYLRKYDARGAHTIGLSPDKQWQYRIAGEQFAEIARAGAKETAIDFVQDTDAPYPTEDAVVWAPDSKSLAFNYSPSHAPHTSYDTVAIYQLRDEKWVRTSPLNDESSRLSLLAQLGKGRLPKNIASEHGGERDILKLRHWTDANTAIIYAYSAHYGGKSRKTEAAYLFTLKFDAQGKWKIAEMHPATAKEKEVP